jgi:hypothetical protein
MVGDATDSQLTIKINRESYGLTLYIGKGLCGFTGLIHISHKRFPEGFMLAVSPSSFKAKPVILDGSDGNHHGNCEGYEEGNGQFFIYFHLYYITFF